MFIFISFLILLLLVQVPCCVVNERILRTRHVWTRLKASLVAKLLAKAAHNLTKAHTKALFYSANLLTIGRE